MTQLPPDSFVQIELIPATNTQQTILANLLELYAHDFSEYHNIQLNEDGRFGYPSLSLYFTDPNRHPFLVKIDGKLAGLVLVKKGSEFSGNQTAWDMAEFFVLRGNRRRGVGTHIAHEVWKLFPGPWEIRVMQSNTAAHHFWASAISKFTHRTVHPIHVEKNGHYWQLFSFEARQLG